MAADLILPSFGETVLSGSGAGGSGPGIPTPPPHEVAQNGVIVALSRIEGFTKEGLLRNPFYFQCAPLETMPRDMSWQWTDYLTLGTGYHSQPNAPELEQWSFDSLFVDSDHNRHYSLTKEKDVLGLVDRLKALGDSMTPFQLQFGNPLLWGKWDVISGATIRGLHVEERAGELDARYFTVTFTEFPDAPTHRAVPRDPTGSKKTKKHHKRYMAVLDSSRLPSGRNTMAELAKHYYGKVSDWRMIAKASGFGKYGPNTDLKATAGKWKPPAKVKIPWPPKATASPQDK
jgi:hypothetical protein